VSSLSWTPEHTVVLSDLAGRLGHRAKGIELQEAVSPEFRCEAVELKRRAGGPLSEAVTEAFLGAVDSVRANRYRRDGPWRMTSMHGAGNHAQPDKSFRPMQIFVVVQPR
jgi:hypothetical protein